MAQNSPAEDIRSLLVNTDGITTPIYINFESPSSTEDNITLYDLPGEEPNPKFLLDFPRIQARSKASNFVNAYDNLLEVFDKLLGRSAVTINTTRYTGIWAVTNILQLGKNDTDRYLVAVTFRLAVEPAEVSQNRKAL